jgi:hypothetical protein
LTARRGLRNQHLRPREGRGSNPGAVAKIKLKIKWLRRASGRPADAHGRQLSFVSVLFDAWTAARRALGPLLARPGHPAMRLHPLVGERRVEVPALHDTDGARDVADLPTLSRGSPRPEITHGVRPTVSGTGTTAHGSWFQNRTWRDVPPALHDHSAPSVSAGLFLH